MLLCYLSQVYLAFVDDMRAAMKNGHDTRKLKEVIDDMIKRFDCYVYPCGVEFNESVINRALNDAFQRLLCWLSNLKVIILLSFNILSCNLLLLYCQDICGIVAMLKLHHTMRQTKERQPREPLVSISTKELNSPSSFFTKPISR